MGIWLTDQGLKASDHQWWTKGFDGFMGYRVDAYGNCCEDCICDEGCQKVDRTSLEFRIYWLEDCRDLDLQFKLYNKSGGFACANNSINGGQYSFECLNPGDEGGHQICWAGDNTQLGGVEIFHTIFDWNLFDQDKVQYQDDEFFKLEIFAHWYEPNYEEGCSNDFHFYALPCGQPPYENCNAEGDINTPFIQKRIANYNIQDRGCSNNKIATLYINRDQIIDEWESGVNQTDYDPRGKGHWYTFA